MYPYIYIVLPSYGVMAFIGAFAVIVFSYFRIEKYNISFSQFIKVVILTAITCVLGSKVLFAITQIPWLIKNFSWLNLLLLIPNSGFVFYGGLFGVIFGLLIYSRKDKELRERLFLFAVPAFPLFHGFGRIGCLLAGCCYGKELSSPWVISGVVEFYKIPVPLFEAVFEFLIFLVLIFAEKKHLKRNTLCVYLLCYAIFRFINEFFRGDDVRGIFCGLSTSQWISLSILLFYTIIFVKTKINKSKSNFDT